MRVGVRWQPPSLNRPAPNTTPETNSRYETGGTQPADHVHPEVVEVMKEKGIDLSDRVPKEVTPDDLRAMDLVITMGCSAEGVCPAAWNGENRDWDLDDPDGQGLDSVREIRDDIEARVDALFEDLVLSQ